MGWILSILLIEVLTGQMNPPVCNVVMSGHLQEVSPMKILHLNIANIYVILEIEYETSHYNLLQQNWCSHSLK